MIYYGKYKRGGRTMIKRTLSVCLAFVLLLGTLVGCSKNETKTDNSGQNTQQETIPELASQYA